MALPGSHARINPSQCAAVNIEALAEYLRERRSQGNLYLVSRRCVVVHRVLASAERPVGSLLGTSTLCLPAAVHSLKRSHCRVRPWHSVPSTVGLQCCAVLPSCINDGSTFQQLACRICCPFEGGTKSGEVVTNTWLHCNLH